MRVMTFNMRYEPDNHVVDKNNPWKERVGRVAKVMREADIVGSQELRFRQLNMLKDLTPEFDFIGETRGDPLDEGSYIFYRKDLYSCILNETLMLSKKPYLKGSKSWGAIFPRILTYGIFIDKEKNIFAVINTHLDHARKRARKHEIKMLIKFINKMNFQIPVMVTGDFNCHPFDSEMHSLQKYPALTSIHQKEKYGDENLTFHDYKGEVKGEPIDYIFFNSLCVAVDYEIIRGKIDGMFCSDHYPIKAIFEFKD